MDGAGAGRLQLSTGRQTLKWPGYPFPGAKRTTQKCTTRTLAMRGSPLNRRIRWFYRLASMVEEARTLLATLGRKMVNVEPFPTSLSTSI